MNIFRRKLTAQGYILLNLIRYLACVLVFLGHFLQVFTWRIFGLSNTMESDNFLVVSFFRLAPHIGVMAFFVLSGFLIAYKAFIEVHETKKFDLVDYLKKRIIRIFPPLYFILFLTLLIVLIIYGCHLFGSESYYFSGESYAVRANASVTFSAIMDCFILLPGATHLSMNGPLWSLSYEFYYYLVFALILTGVINKNWRQSFYLSLSVIVIPLIFCFFMKDYYKSILNVWLLFSIWGLGVVIAYFYVFKKKLITSKTGLLISLFILFIFFPLAAWSSKIVYYSQLMGGFFSSFLIMAALNFKGEIHHLFEKTSRASVYTFTLYLLNVPIMMLVLSLLGDRILGFHWYDYTILFVILFVLLSIASAYLANILENRERLLKMMPFLFKYNIKLFKTDKVK